MQFNRIWQHLLFAPSQTRRLFPTTELDELTLNIAQSENHHRGEIRLVIESSYSLPQLFNRLEPRQRALELFSQYRVWDTEENTGVLIYLLLAERRIEIIADRGIARKLPQTEWDAICKNMQATFAQGQFIEGIKSGMTAITQHLAEHFPADVNANPNELPDRPVVIY